MKLRGIIWAADTCHCSWTLKEACHTAQNLIPNVLNHHNQAWNTIPMQMIQSQRKHLQHQKMMHSLLFSTHHCLQQRTFPLHFSKPYLHNWDFKDSDQVLRYITKYFNHETIHRSLKSFPDLSTDFIYSNTYMDTHHFSQLQHYINKSI